VKVFLDSNILLRLAQPVHPHHPLAQSAVATLHDRGVHLCMVPQTVYEFWVVATRPLTVNGLGLTVSDSQAEVARFKRMFPLLPDLGGLFSEWEKIVYSGKVSGRQAHDARLVAAMHTHGLTELLTFNGSDFRRFPGVTVLDLVAP
jgi:predicted nucleic acid-binding protein